MPDNNHPVAVDVKKPAGPRKAVGLPRALRGSHGGPGEAPLGEPFGLTNFGVNLTTLAPGAVSALRHGHSRQDEFVYILEGCPTLHTDEGRTRLSPGMCAGFKAGGCDAHQLINETDETVAYLEVGDRTPGDEAHYPDDDLKAEMIKGQWRFAHKDGRPW
ncbi:cupin domain-containing protein [Marinobacterium aestuariivivens]|uniref:Cupin domain-containing protein n=1 Tax=Marinobacterium aestuariivivens TaxID=1698799 RepID=A0ABW2A4Y0_9GAMM